MPSSKAQNIDRFYIQYSVKIKIWTQETYLGQVKVSYLFTVLAPINVALDICPHA